MTNVVSTNPDGEDRRFKVEIHALGTSEVVVELIWENRERAIDLGLVACGTRFSDIDYAKVAISRSIHWPLSTAIADVDLVRVRITEGDERGDRGLQRALMSTIGCRDPGNNGKSNRAESDMHLSDESETEGLNQSQIRPSSFLI
jgi:hypothetical protein